MSLLNPTSIAVIGASGTEGKVGHFITKNLLTQGFTGTVYPINPKHAEILGAEAYPDIREVPGGIDIAVIVTPARTVPAIITHCAEKGVQNVVVISAGFGEIHTEAGDALEQEVQMAARTAGINLVGPNCLGILRPELGLNASFAKDLPNAGNIAFISQSGAMAVAVMDASPPLHLGYSFVASIGNKTCMDESDFLELLMEDTSTEVIGMYLESIKDGQRFLEITKKLAPQKPIVLLKSGVSEQGRRAAASHTGALAGSNSAIDAVCRQAGVHRADTAEELFDLLRVLSTQPVLLSNRIAVITNAGGPGILATDATEVAKLTMPELTEKNAEILRNKLPAAASVHNPIDVLGDAVADRYQAALKACGDDQNIDGIAVLLTPQVMTPCSDIARVICEETKDLPLMPVVTSFMGGETVQEAGDILATNGIPNFETPARAIAALGALLPHSHRQQSEGTVDSERQKNVQSLLAGKTGLLDEQTTQQLFELYNLPLPWAEVATTEEEAVSIAEKISYPVIAKISSPDILHKTDVGGIKANLKDPQAVTSAFTEIMSSCHLHKPNAKLNGVLIQQFLPIGSEFIIGSIREPSFGPMVMVGLGGIYTELFKDTSFRIAPIASAEAYEMLQDLTAWKLLLGMRGKKQSDIDALAELMVRISQLVSEAETIIELDINPVLVGEEGIVIADVKIVLG